MSTEIEFVAEKKWTIVISHIDLEKMEAWVSNVGMNESQLKREFKMAKTNGFEKEISCHELKTMLNYVATNCIIEAVLEIENHYNTDQKTINELKRNIENKLKSKGYTIVEHCFSSGEINVDPGSVYETRAYLKLLNDRCTERKIELSKIKVEEKTIELEVNALKHDKEIMQKEFDDLCIRYKKGKDFLKEVEENVSKYKDNVYIFDEKEKEFKRLNDDIEKGISSLNDIKEQIKKKNIELSDIDTKIELANTKYNEIRSSLEKYIRLSREL